MKKVFRICVYLIVGTFFWGNLLSDETFAADKKLILWRLNTYVKDANSVLDKNIKEWGEKNNCEVVIETYTFDEKATKFTAAIESKTLPDVAEFDALLPARLYGLNRLEDVTDMVSEISKELGKPLPNLEINMKFGGKFYSVPHYASTIVMYYRKDILNKLDLKPPEMVTWDEFYDGARKIKKAGILDFPVGLPWNRTQDGQDPALAIFWNEGASWCDKNGYYKSINTPQGLKSVELMVRSYMDGTSAKDYLAWSGATNNEAWMAGKICYTANSPSIFWQLRSFKHPLIKDTGITLQPKGTYGQVQPLSILMSWGVPIDRGNKNLAKSLIRYLMSRDTFEVYIKASAQQAGPLYENLMKTDYWNDEYGRVIIRNIKTAYPLGWPGPITSVAASEVMTTNVLTDIVGRVIIDKLTPKNALKEADEKIKTIYKRFNMIK